MTTSLETVVKSASESKKSVLDYVQSLNKEQYDATLSQRNIQRFSEDIDAQISAKKRKIEDLEDSKVGAVRNGKINTEEGRQAVLITIAGTDVEIAKLEKEITSLTNFKDAFLTVK